MEGRGNTDGTGDWKSSLAVFIGLLAHFLTMTNQQTVSESCITGNEPKQPVQSRCLHIFN